MTKTIFVINILLVVSINIAFSCKSLPEKKTDFQQPEAINQECLEWKNIMDSLSSEEKARLQRDNAIRKEGVGWIISDALIKECGLRKEVGAYIGRVISGQSENKKEDRDFVAQHSPEIVAVIRKLWPTISDSKAFVVVRDGAFDSEKYGLLADPAFRESDIAPLISDILAAEGIENDLAYILFARPMLGTKQALLHLQKDAETQNNIRWQIINLSLLHKMKEPSALPKLERLSLKTHLTATETKTLKPLIIKAKRGEEIVFSDIEDLEYTYDEKR